MLSGTMASKHRKYAPNIASRASMNQPSNLSSDAFAPRDHACPQSEGRADDPLVYVPMHSLTVVDVRGEDAQSFLQSKLTINLDLLSERGTAYGYSTDINGRVLFDVHIAQLEPNAFRLWSEPMYAETIVEALDKYIIMEDVTLEIVDMPDAWMLVGTDEESLRQHLNLPPSKAEEMGYAQHEETGVLKLSRSLRPAYLLEGEARALREDLRAQGACAVNWQDWRAYEIHEGFVRVGQDLLPGQTIPLEAGADLGVDYNKGCYLGQEVIERLRSRGTPSREYRRVTIIGEMPDAGAALPATLVDADGKNAGLLTSVAHADERTVGIAVIRRRQLRDADAKIFVASPDGPMLQELQPVR